MSKKPETPIVLAATVAACTVSAGIAAYLFYKTYKTMKDMDDLELDFGNDPVLSNLYGKE